MDKISVPITGVSLIGCGLSQKSMAQIPLPPSPDKSGNTRESIRFCTFAGFCRLEAATRPEDFIINPFTWGKNIE